MITMAQRKTLTDMLREALNTSTESLSHIARESGVEKASLVRFRRGDYSIRLDLADRLAEYFGIEHRLQKRRR